MTRKLLLLFVTILAATLADIQKARACSCWPPPAPAQALAQADAVLMGKVDSFEFIENGDRRLAKISLVKIWKGDRGAVGAIYTSANAAVCGYDSQVGETYLIYAHEGELGRLVTGLCERTAPVDAAMEDLNYLQTQAYYPLAIRNTWMFAQKETQSRYQENITDTLRITGQLYYRFDHFREFDGVPIRLSDDGKLFMHLGATEQLWLDFGAQVGDKWNVRAPNGLAEWTVELQSKIDTVNVQAGTFIGCFRFRFHFDGADNDWDEWYALGAGPVKRVYYGIALFDYVLTSAIIDGKPLPTSVSDQPHDRSVRTFDLAQSYPNPFVPVSNNTITIRYRLTEAAAVTLRIYDTLGREIQTLVERHEPAGERVAIWNGLDARGNKVPNGIYFYRLQAGKRSEIKKIVLTQ